jgi:CRISPR-associated protein (TIGR02584 family)
MLGELRKYTADSATTVLCSIAGGRKTMSALLFSCMSLLGREDDKVYHVMLPQEFEGGTTQVVYFPKKGAKYKLRLTGKAYPGAKEQSELFEFPFVRMRGWYQDKFKTLYRIRAKVILTNHQ